MVQSILFIYSSTTKHYPQPNYGFK